MLRTSAAAALLLVTTASSPGCYRSHAGDTGSGVDAGVADQATDSGGPGPIEPGGADIGPVEPWETRAPEPDPVGAAAIVDFPPPHSIMARPAITIRGRTHGSTAAIRARVPGGNTYQVEVSGARFSLTVPLAAGPNAIEVVAVSRTGATTPSGTLSVQRTEALIDRIRDMVAGEADRVWAIAEIPRTHIVELSVELGAIRSWPSPSPFTLDEIAYGGGYVFVYDDRKVLYRVDPMTGAGERMPREGTRIVDNGLSVNAEGTVAFTCGRGTGERGVVRWDLVTGEQRRIADTECDYTVVDPVEPRIAVRSRVGLLVIPTDGSPPRALADARVGHITVAPDGQLYSFDYPGGGGGHLARRDWDTGGVTQAWRSSYRPTGGVDFALVHSGGHAWLPYGLLAVGSTEVSPIPGVSRQPGGIGARDEAGRTTHGWSAATDGVLFGEFSLRELDWNTGGMMSVTDGGASGGRPLGMSADGSRLLLFGRYGPGRTGGWLVDLSRGVASPTESPGLEVPMFSEQGESWFGLQRLSILGRQVLRLAEWEVTGATRGVPVADLAAGATRVVLPPSNGQVWLYARADWPAEVIRVDYRTGEVLVHQEVESLDRRGPLLVTGAWHDAACHQLWIVTEAGAVTQIVDERDFSVRLAGLEESLGGTPTFATRRRVAFRTTDFGHVDAVDVTCAGTDVQIARMWP